ncbi:MAG: YceI family protein [Bacteroidetes bacterium]|nr:YceI family protein [Fibrella sp.]
MKTILFFSFLFMSTLPASAQRYVADSQQSKLTWTGHSEVGNYAPSGALQLQQGVFTVNGTQITQGRIDIDMRTIQHDDDKMQTHLRGEDFFNAPKFPTATFVLQQIKGNQASGLLTIKGVTKPVTFPIGVAAEGDALRIKGKATIDRTVFGIKYNSTSFFSGLGDYAIKNTFELAFDVVARRGNTASNQ